MTPFPSPASGSEDPATDPASEQRPAAGGSSAAGTGSSSTGAPAPASEPGAQGFLAGFHSWVRSLGIVRGDDRWFGGVAAGIAARTGLDPVLVRGLFVVLGIFGIGFLVYGLAWALLPEPDGRIHLDEAVRGTWTSGMTGALIFAVIGMGGPGTSFLGTDSWFGALVWTLFWIGAGVAAVSWFSTGKAWPHLSGHGTGPGADGSSANSTAAAGKSGGGPGTGAPAAGGKPVSLSKSGTAATEPATAPGPAGPEPVSGAHPFSAAAHGGLSGAVPSSPAAVPSSPAADPELPEDRQGGCGSTKKRAPGASAPVTAALFGAGLLVGGAVLALDYVNVLSLGSPLSVALAAAAVVFGAAVAVLGLAGRHGSGIGAAAVAALVAAFLTQGTWTNANVIVAGEADWAPRDAAEASSGYTYVAGNGVLDLRGTESSGDYEVPASVAMGNISILVPEDSPVTVLFGMAAGNVMVHDGSDQQSYGGLWQPGAEHTLNDGADGDRITIDLRGLASNVLVTTEESDL